MSVIRFEDVFSTEDWQQHVENISNIKSPGVCIFTDGGFKSKRSLPNASWAIHSYFYDDAKPKASKYKNVFLTKNGYANSSDKRTEAVNGKYVFDASGLIHGDVTNNIAELQAFILALDLVLKTGLKDCLGKVVILSDSKYVVENANLHLKNWIARGWKVSSGQPVLNLEYWKVINAQLDELYEMDVDLSYRYCVGHEDHGNIIADSYCNLAILNGIELNNFSDEDWLIDKEIGIDKMFRGQRYIHFPGLVEGYEDFAYMVSFLDTSIPISHLGCRLEDISFSLIKTKDEKTIDNLKIIHRECEKLEELISPVPMVVDLKNMLSNRFNYLLEHGYLPKLPIIEEIDKIIIPDPSAGNKIIEIIQPPRNSFKALDEFKKAIRIIQELDDPENNSVQLTDITSNIYQIVQEKGKDINKFILTTESSLEVEINQWVVDKIEKAEVTLTLGLDLPRRDVLQGLAGDNPKVSVVTWERGDFSFRYATLIETENSCGFFFNPYSNVKLLY